MGRPVSTDLQNLLDLQSCETQTTLDLYLEDTTEIHVATAELADTETGTFDYTDDLRTSNELQQSVGTPPNRGTVSIQNADKVFGGYVTGEDLVHAVAVIGRIYRDENGALPSVWVELFRGEAFPLGVDETVVELEVLSDLVASGFCVSDWTLAENCQFRFKHAGTCGYSGGETLCNKKRRSKLGCLGRANEHRFGGMEYPDIQTPAVPVGGTGSGGGHHNCPRVDQWIPVAGVYGGVIARLAGNIRKGDRLYDPLSGRFETVKSAEIVENVPIWEIRGSNGVAGYSSQSHPVFPYSEHENGIPVSQMWKGDPILMWHRVLDDLIDRTLTTCGDTGKFGNVVRIELESGHVYAYGNSTEIFIVCHNSKDPGEIIVI